MKKILSLILVIISIFTLSACSKNMPAKKSNTENKESKKIIAVSILPQKNFVEAVCGAEAEVVAMIPHGASPETYEPSPTQMQALEQADIYFSIGIQSEKNSILPSLNNNTKHIALDELVFKSHKKLTINGEKDPHIWLSPKRVMAMVSIIAETLGAEDTANAEKYNENALDYIAKLTELDSEINEMLNQKTKKDFIVFHPSLGYLADDYGLKMHALEENGKEATAKGLAKLTDFAKEKNIKTIFYDAENSGKQALAFAEGIGGKAIILNPLAEDYIENLKKIAEDISSSLE